MGIPKFYRDWVAKHNFNGVLLGEAPSAVSSLFLDVNGIIHKAAAEAWGYSETSTPELRKLLAKVNPYELYAKFEFTFSSMLSTVVASFSPKDLLIIAVDGVAPVAKIQQQRQRRYKAASKRGPTDLFDTNSITPGTDFMIALDNYIERWIITNRLVLPSVVIYSSYKVPGEGEHKIMDLIRQGKVTGDGAHILYGLDADLIMLSLLAPLNGIFLSREDDNDIVSIDNLREVLKTYMKSTTAIDDFVVMMYLIGNDFLPHSNSLGRMSKAIDIMAEVYRSIGKPLTAEGEIILPNLGLFLTELAKLEPNMLAEYAPHLLGKEERRDIFEFPSKIIAASTDGKTFNYDTYRELWYRNALLPRGDVELFAVLGIPEPELTVDSIQEMCQQYITGMAWSYAYYQGGMTDINTLFYYPYHHSPLLLDLSYVASQTSLVEGYYAVEGQLQYNALHQLLAVLPPLSASLLPLEIRDLATSSNGPITDLFPDKFTLEVDGLKDATMGTAILPFADLPRIVDAVESYVVVLPDRLVLWEAAEAKEDVPNPQLLEDIQRRRAAVATVKRASQRGRGGGRGRGGRYNEPRQQTTGNRPPPQIKSTARPPSVSMQPISVPSQPPVVPFQPISAPSKISQVPIRPISVPQSIAPVSIAPIIKQSLVPTLPTTQRTVQPWTSKTNLM